MGFLIQFKFSRLLRMKNQAEEWETSTESVMEVGQWLCEGRREAGQWLSIGEGCTKQEATVSSGGWRHQRLGLGTVHSLSPISWFVNQIGDFFCTGL